MKHWFTTSTAVAGILLCATSIRADIDLHFSYDSEADTTTVSWSGIMGVDSTVNGDLTSPRMYMGTHYLEGGGNVGSVSYELMDSTANTPWDDLAGPGFGSNFKGDNWRFDPVIYMGPANYNAATEVAGSMDFAGRDLAELGFDASEIANGGTIVLDTAGGNVNVNWSAEAIPEPSVITLCALFGGGMLFIRRRLMM